MKLAHLLVATALVAAPLAASAQTAPGPALEPTVTVGGDGRIERAPDLARISLEIVTNDDDAARSAGKNTTIVNAVKAKLAGAGIASDKIRTSYFNVNFVPYPPKNLPPEQRQPRYGYITTRGLSVEVVPVENAGKVVDAANAAGVTSVGDVSYDLKDRTGAYHLALAQAMADAKATANALASGGGFALGRLMRVSTQNEPRFGTPQPFPMARMAVAAAPAPPTDLGNAGPIVVTAHVDVTYAIR